jgi:hypothetical protein
VSRFFFFFLVLFPKLNDFSFSFFFGLRQHIDDRLWKFYSLQYLFSQFRPSAQTKTIFSSFFSFSLFSSSRLELLEQGEDRLKYKMGFYRTFQVKCEEWLKSGRSLIIVGDLNTAHKPIDIFNPVQWQTQFCFIEYLPNSLPFTAFER